MKRENRGAGCEEVGRGLNDRAERPAGDELLLT